MCSLPDTLSRAGNANLHRLACCNLGPEGAAALAEALKTNATLTALQCVSSMLCDLKRMGSGGQCRAAPRSCEPRLQLCTVAPSPPLPRPAMCLSEPCLHASDRSVYSNDIEGGAEALGEAMKVNIALTQLECVWLSAALLPHLLAALGGAV